MKCCGLGELSIQNKKQNKLLCFIDMVCHSREICGEICQFFALKKEGLVHTQCWETTMMFLKLRVNGIV
jgi:hypothetical protein